MERLVTTAPEYIWCIKNPQDYWADFANEVKYILYINGKRIGGFSGVNRSFDDAMFYVNFFDDKGKFDHCAVLRDTEIVLEPVDKMDV